MAVAAILSLNLFIFLPYTLYLGNVDQMEAPISGVLLLCLMPTILLFLSILVIGRMVSGQMLPRVTVFLAVISILIWLQGNIISWDYGILNGRNIDWGQDLWRGWLDISIWIIAILTSIFLHGIIGKNVVKIAVAVFLIQLITMVFSGFESRAALHQEATQSSNNALEEIYRFSSTRNVLHLVLDGFQADILQELLERPAVRELLEHELEGFVYYPETLAVFPYTRFAVPAFLGGKIYKAQTRKDAFIDSALSGKTILNLANDKGYAAEFAQTS